MSPGESLALLQRLPVGPELITALAALPPVRRRTTDAAGVREILPDAGEQVMVAQLVQKAQSWLDSVLNAAVLQIAGPRISPDDEDWGREEIAAGLRWSGSAAADRLEVARALAGRSFLTGRALAEGSLTYRHAAEIVQALEPLDDATAAAVEAGLLGAAGSKTPAQLARRARKDVAKADPRGAEERHRRARTGRRVDFTPLPDGMAELRAILPADDAARARAALDQFAGRSRGGGDDRTLDQRRADALVALTEIGALAASGLIPGEPEGSTPSRSAELIARVVAGKRAVPPRIALTAPLSSALGASDLPGELTGYGPFPASLVRELAADSRWEKWITGTGGVVTDLGRTTYRPSAELAALIRATYPTCVFPGCSQPSHRCDLDHNVRRIDGGETSATNLVPLCRRHHRAKDEAGWSLHHDPSTGTCSWTSPAGHTYTVDPPDHREEPVVPADWSLPLVPEPAPAGAPTSSAADDPPPF